MQPDRRAFLSGCAAAPLALLGLQTVSQAVSRAGRTLPACSASVCSPPAWHPDRPYDRARDESLLEDVSRDLFLSRECYDALTTWSGLDRPARRARGTIKSQRCDLATWSSLDRCDGSVQTVTRLTADIDPWPLPQWPIASRTTVAEIPSVFMHFHERRTPPQPQPQPKTFAAESLCRLEYDNLTAGEMLLLWRGHLRGFLDFGHTNQMVLFCDYFLADLRQLSGPIPAGDVVVGLNGQVMSSSMPVMHACHTGLTWLRTRHASAPSLPPGQPGRGNYHLRFDSYSPARAGHGGEHDA